MRKGGLYAKLVMTLVYRAIVDLPYLCEKLLESSQKSPRKSEPIKTWCLVQKNLAHQVRCTSLCGSSDELYVTRGQRFEGWRVGLTFSGAATHWLHGDPNHSQAPGVVSTSWNTAHPPMHQVVSLLGFWGWRGQKNAWTWLLFLDGMKVASWIFWAIAWGNLPTKRAKGLSV